jgi:hypothetical protein
MNGAQRWGPAFWKLLTDQSSDASTRQQEFIEQCFTSRRTSFDALQPNMIYCITRAGNEQQFVLLQMLKQVDETTWLALNCSGELEKYEQDVRDLLFQIRIKD